MSNVHIMPRQGFYEVTRGELVAYVKRGYVLIRCKGQLTSQVTLIWKTARHAPMGRGDGES